jgi:hypothetical protein
MGCGDEEVQLRDRRFCMRLFVQTGNFMRDS